MPDTYDKAIVQTFRKNAIHTALLVDDKFPTYDQLSAAYDEVGQGDFQLEHSTALYSTFFNRNIPCDVENSVDRIDETDFSRLRKSDLIVLDYHLRERDPSSSINVIKRLARSKHFNIVVLYTSESPATAWLEIASHLCGGWGRKHDNFNGDMLDEWDSFEYEVSPDDVIQYILGDSKKEIGRIVERLTDYFAGESVHEQYHYRLIEAALHAYIEDEFGDSLLGHEQVAMKSNCSEDKCWIQCRNLFLVIKQKDDESQDGDDPKGIIHAIDEALIDWNPNPFQIMISNIQNILEREGLATDSEYFDNKNFQMGLAYSMAAQFTEVPSVDDMLPIALKKVQDDLLEYLQHRTSRKMQDQEIVHNVFESKAAPLTDEKNIVKIAEGIIGEAFPNGTINEILFERNKFVSTQEFSESHLTNGTIFRAADDDGNFDYWVCTYASCDLVPRESKGKSWRNQLFPFRPFTAVKLVPNGKPEANVPNAEDARILFFECDGKGVCFKALNDEDKPNIERMYGMDALVVQQEAGKKVFRAHRLFRKKDENKEDCLESQSCVFEVVGQLRRAYASRLLAKVANHKSRIGLDYIAPH